MHKRNANLHLNWKSAQKVKSITMKNVQNNDFMFELSGIINRRLFCSIQT